MAGPSLLRLAPAPLGTPIVPLDSAANVVFPAIVAVFGLAETEIQWVVTCYVLTSCRLMLAVGRLGDIFGHARVFRSGLAGSAGSAIDTAARSPWCVIGAVTRSR